MSISPVKKRDSTKCWFCTCFYAFSHTQIIAGWQGDNHGNINLLPPLLIKSSYHRQNCTINTWIRLTYFLTVTAVNILVFKLLCRKSSKLADKLQIRNYQSSTKLFEFPKNVSNLCITKAKLKLDLDGLVACRVSFVFAQQLLIGYFRLGKGK